MSRFGLWPKFGSDVPLQSIVKVRRTGTVGLHTGQSPALTNFPLAVAGYFQANWLVTAMVFFITHYLCFSGFWEDWN